MKSVTLLFASFLMLFLFSCEEDSAPEILEFRSEQTSFVFDTTDNNSVDASVSMHVTIFDNDDDLKGLYVCRVGSVEDTSGYIDLASLEENDKSNPYEMEIRSEYKYCDYLGSVISYYVYAVDKKGNVSSYSDTLDFEVEVIP